MEKTNKQTKSETVFKMFEIYRTKKLAKPLIFS